MKLSSIMNLVLFLFRFNGKHFHRGGGPANDGPSFRPMMTFEPFRIMSWGVAKKNHESTEEQSNSGSKELRDPLRHQYSEARIKNPVPAPGIRSRRGNRILNKYRYSKQRRELIPHKKQTGSGSQKYLFELSVSTPIHLIFFMKAVYQSDVDGMRKT